MHSAMMSRRRMTVAMAVAPGLVAVASVAEACGGSAAGAAQSAVAGVAIVSAANITPMAPGGVANVAIAIIGLGIGLAGDWPYSVGDGPDGFAPQPVSSLVTDLTTVMFR